MQNKNGFTLIEVMVSLLLSLLIFLAVMQVALMGMNYNMTNALRDEAVNVAEQQMNQVRNQVSSVAGFTALGNPPLAPFTISRNFRNVSNFNYTVNQVVAVLNANNKQVTITVTWPWKGQNTTHIVNTVLRMPGT